MKRNLIFYDGCENKECAEAFGRIIGNCRVSTIESNAKMSLYESVIFLCSDTAEGRFMDFIKALKENLKGKEMYFVGKGLLTEDFNKLCSCMNKVTGMPLKYSGFLKEVSADGGDFSKAVYNMASDIRNMIYGRSDDISRGEVLEAIKEYLNNNNTCTLGTGADGYVRCTPIEYTYMNGAFYLITEGGMKFYGILQNKNVSLAVYDKYEGMGGRLKGLQVQGTAHIIPKGSDEYYKVMEVKGVNKAAVEKLPIDMSVIKIVPSKYEFLNSDFKKMGVDTKQTVDMLNK